MQLDVQDAGPCKKTLNFVVPVADVDRQFEEKYAEIGKKVPFPGFRPGRAPRSLIEKRLGREIAREVTTELVQERFKQALEDSELDPLGQPEFDLPEEPAAEGEEYRFAVSFEIEPAIELADYRRFELEDPFAASTDEDTEIFVRTVSRRMSREEKVDPGTPLEEDMVAVLRLQLRTTEGEEIFSTSRQKVYLEEPRIPGGEVPELGPELLGKIQGHEGLLTLTLPADYPREAYREVPVELAYEILEVLRQVPPPDDELLREAGHETFDSWRQELRALLDQRRRQDANAAMEEQILTQLLERHPFDLPQGLQERMARSDHEEIHGHADPDLESPEWQAIEEAVIRQLRRHFLLDAIADEELISVSESDVERELALQSAQQHIPVQLLRQEYQRQGLLAGLRAEIRRRKVLSHLRNQAIAEASAAEA